VSSDKNVLKTAWLFLPRIWTIISPLEKKAVLVPLHDKSASECSSAKTHQCASAMTAAAMTGSFPILVFQENIITRNQEQDWLPKPFAQLPKKSYQFVLSIKLLKDAETSQHI